MFLKALVHENAEDPAKLCRWLDAKRNYYLARSHKLSAPGRRMNRVPTRMATVYAAGAFRHRARRPAMEVPRPA